MNFLAKSICHSSPSRSVIAFKCVNPRGDLSPAAQSVKKYFSQSSGSFRNVIYVHLTLFQVVSFIFFNRLRELPLITFSHPSRLPSRFPRADDMLSVTFFFRKMAD